MGEFNNKSSPTVETFNINFKLCDKSSSDCRDDAATPQDIQRNGGRGNVDGGGASKHLLPANNEEFGGDDDADDDALKPPGLDR